MKIKATYQNQKIVFKSYAEFYKCTDNTDVIRLNMLAMELSNGNHTIDSIKQTTGFNTAFTNFNLSDEYILELIEKVKELEIK